jgi:hypothetical protein
MYAESNLILNKISIQLDIWGNISKYKRNDFWVKQSFIENELIQYEDFK